MGNNTTFHPIAPNELQTYVFDILINPALSQSRIPWLNEYAQEQDYLRDNIYATLVSNNEERVDFCSAAIAGYLHPYFYSRQPCFPLLAAQINSLKDSLTNLSDLFLAISPCHEHIQLGKTNFLYIKPDQIKTLRSQLLSKEHTKLRNEYIKKDDWKSLLAALDYCDINKLGLLEAQNIIRTENQKNVSFPANLRAAHLNNLHNLQTERYVQIFPDSLKQLTEITDKHLPLIQQGILDIKLPFNYINKAPKETLEIVASYCNTSKAILAFSTTTPTDVLDRLSSDNTFSNGPNAEVEPHYLPMLVASNRSTSADTLNRLADQDYLTIRDCVAEHANTSPETLRRLFNSVKEKANNSRLRRRIADNPNTPKDVLACVSSDIHTHNTTAQFKLTS